MSGMDDRAKQFKEAAEAKPKDNQLMREITTLRRFLFRNQEYRFTKSAQGYLYMAVVAHHANSVALDTGSSGEDEPPVLKLLDDALKMPFTVFSSSQKDRLLQLYWSVLGTPEKDGPPATAAAARRRDLTLLDCDADGALSLMLDDGSEYAGKVVISDKDTLTELRAGLDSGASVVITVSEVSEGNTAAFVGFYVEDE